MTAPVRRLRRKDIDDARWDATAGADQLGFPYGLCWWLDAVTEGRWEGLILGDYRVVLPIPIFKKIGPLALINGAPFTQHFGPFGEKPELHTNTLLAELPARFFVKKLALRSKISLPRFKLSPRTNYELNLNQDYKDIATNYRADLRRKLRRSKLSTPDLLPAESFYRFYRQHLGQQIEMPERLLQAVSRLLTANQNYGQGKCYCVRSTESQEILAVLFLARQHTRIINLLATSSPAGFKQNAMAVLIDGIIREHAGQDILFDFEGSDLPGVATFFRSFGAQKLEYFQCQDKRLVAMSLP